MTAQVKNVFISHIHEDDEGLDKFKELLETNGMTVHDYSINADNPNNARSEEYIKDKILAPRIQQSSVLVVYISPETKDSEYVDWEIEYAEKKGKRIVGVWAHGENECEVPDALDKHADAVIGWTGDRIMDAINGKINGWQCPAGKQRELRKIPRAEC